MLLDLGNPVANHPLNYSLLGFWVALPNNQGGGTWFDLTRRCDATIQTGVTWGSGDGRGFVGLSSSTGQSNIPWASVATNATLNSLGTGPGTILTRFRTTSHNRNERVICFGANSTWQYLYYSATGKMALFNGSFLYSASTTPTLNEWHTGGYSYSGGNAAFYWDGVPDGTATPGGMTSASGLDLNIGSDIVAGTLDYLLGDLAWVAIWNRALTDDEHWRWEDESRQGFPNVLRRWSRRSRGYVATSPPPAASSSNLLLLGCG